MQGMERVAEVAGNLREGDRVWMADEEEWAVVAETRAKHGEILVELRYTHDESDHPTFAVVYGDDEPVEVDRG